MSSESPGEAPERARPYVRYSAKLARVICQRLAAGETVRAICAEPGLPSRATVHRWVRESAAFARIYTRAKAFGCRVADGRGATYCPVAAHEIAVRVSEGEPLSDIAEDPSMPSLGTIFHWRRSFPDFADALNLAREAFAERMTDLGWKMAMEATPETAHLTRVRLAQLRWTTAIKSPRTHGRLKSTEPEDPPKVTKVLFRHFKVEKHPETGQVRVVGYTPDPATMTPVRDSEGEWTDIPDPVAKMAEIDRLTAERLARQGLTLPGGG